MQFKGDLTSKKKYLARDPNNFKLHNYYSKTLCCFIYNKGNTILINSIARSV